MLAFMDVFNHHETHDRRMFHMVIEGEIDQCLERRQWRLPEANVFRYPLGHLGTPVQLMRDSAPFERLRQVLDG